MLNTSIDYIRYFQRYEMHDEALEFIRQLDLNEYDLMTQVKIYKLTSFSYRKLQSTEYALLNINKAIHLVEDLIESYNCSEYNKELAICLMNKGVIYDSQNDYMKACEIYAQAVSIFESIDDLETGILINALINYGEALFNANKCFFSFQVFSKAKALFNDFADERYLYIDSRLQEMKKLK